MFEFYKDKTVAVTGSTGLVGSYLVKALVDAGAKVRAVAHNRQANEYTRMAHDIVKADLTEAGSVTEAVRNTDVVVHAAGIAGGAPLAINDPGAMVAPNAIIDCQLIHACAHEKVRWLGYTSSIVVYPALNEPMKEDQAWSAEPYELYSGLAWVKRFGEKLCSYYQKKYGMNIAIIRPSGAYGRFDNFNENTSHVLPALIKRALTAGEKMKVWGDGLDVRDFVHSSDIAKGMLLALERHAVCDPINIASGRAVTTRELAEVILEVTGSRAELEFDKSKPTALRTRRVDVSKAGKLLGYHPSVSLKEGLTDTVEWYRKQVARDVDA